MVCTKHKPRNKIIVERFGLKDEPVRAVAEVPEVIVQGDKRVRHETLDYRSLISSTKGQWSCRLSV